MASRWVQPLDNGLLLRTDVHTLFDAGYLTVMPDLRVRVSGRIREEFENHWSRPEGRLRLGDVGRLVSL